VQVCHSAYLEVTNIASSISENIGLVHHTSRRVHNRILQSGVTVDYDDVFQEASIIWLTCESKFDASLGFKFSTYFVQSVNFSVFRGYQKKNDRFNAFTINMLDDDDDFFEPEDSSLPVDQDDEYVWAARLIDGLSPFAEKMVKILLDPPQLILDSLEAMNHKAEYARGLGVDRRSPKELTLSSLCIVLNVSRGVRQRVVAEVERAFNDRVM